MDQEHINYSNIYIETVFCMINTRISTLWDKKGYNYISMKSYITREGKIHFSVLTSQASLFI